jgi:hypothetical protein
MRFKAIVCLLAILCVLSGSVHETGASPVSNVTFGGPGITIELKFPEEAHPTETITHNLTLTALTSLVLQNFTLVIKVLVNMSWQQVYKEQVFLRSMEQSEALISEGKFTLPQNAHETLYCNMHVLTDRVSEPLTCTFYTTNVRTMTYNELLANYSSLLTDYETLLGSYNNLSTRYGGLNSTYNLLLNQHSSLLATFASLNSSYFIQKAVYDALRTSYDSLDASYKTLNQTYYAMRNTIDTPEAELTTTRYITYALIAVTVALVALVIYLKKKKDEPYVVLRKETVALNPTEQTTRTR